jgi:hypothetical protein
MPAKRRCGLADKERTALGSGAKVNIGAIRGWIIALGNVIAVIIWPADVRTRTASTKQRIAEPSMSRLGRD